MDSSTTTIRILRSTNTVLHGIKRQLAVQQDRTVSVTDAVDEIVRFYVETHMNRKK